MLPALLLSILSVDGGRVLSVREGVLTLEDARIVSVDGGVWLSDEKAAAIALELKEARRLSSPPPPPPPTAAPINVESVVSAIVTLVVGLYVAFK